MEWHWGGRHFLVCTCWPLVSGSPALVFTIPGTLSLRHLLLILLLLLPLLPLVDHVCMHTLPSPLMLLVPLMVVLMLLLLWLQLSGCFSCCHHTYAHPLAVVAAHMHQWQ